ncbi:MAG: ethanolamine utilization protein EutH [Lachnospiraceae bacterium]|nr:ethanolamine utilization protein EutH [Lachnospiraceae bacterium]
MSVNQIIVYTMVAFMVLAAIDRCFGSRLGLGDAIDEALAAMGPLTVPMAGMILLSPMLGRFLAPIVSPFYKLLGADPALFGPSLLACDMGGYSLAYAMAESEEAARFSGCLLGVSLGATITFVIPVGLGLIRKSLRQYFAVGVLVGITTIPFGLIAGGFAAGFSPSLIFHNTIPVAIIAAVIALGIWKAQAFCIRIFTWLGKLVIAVSTVGFAIGIIQELTPLVLIENLTSVLDGIKIVGSCAIVLCGAYPFLRLVNRFLGKPLARLGKLIGIDQAAVSGILGGIANIMPVLNGCNSMSPAGVVVSVAFAISGSCLLGDHLGFYAAVDPEMIGAMLVTKIVGFLTAMAAAIFLCRRRGYSTRPLPEEEGAAE